MKHLFFSLLAVVAIMNTSHGQNLLPPVWKYTKVDSATNARELQWGSCPEVNLLLSWERQGLCWIDRDIVLRNSFRVDAGNKSRLVLEFSLQGDVKGVRVNGHLLAANIGNSFWSKRGHITSIPLPDSLLVAERENEITVAISNLSYTGGLSHNLCSIKEQNATVANSLSFVFPTPNHVYLPGSTMQCVISSKNTSESKIHVLIHTDAHKLVLDTYIPAQAGKHDYPIDLSTHKLEPGLYQCLAMSEGNTYCNSVAWFAVAPENMPISNQKPEGFDAFWQKNLDELHAINPDYKLEKVESLCSETRDGYTVEMKSLGNLTIRGYYFVPKTGSKHPAILHLPGYSYGFEHLDGFKNRKGDCAELAICVRGHGISKDVFNPWDSITLWAVGVCNKESYVYRSIYMDGVRALEFLASQPNIDTKRIGVAGGSQGGALTLAVAAMCPTLVAGCAFFDPWLCDFDNQRRIRTMVDKELEQFRDYPSVRCSTNHMLSVLDYFDTKHFAPAIKCPAYFLTALFDDDCPSRCGFSAFNSLKTKKEYIVFPNDSHLGESGEYDSLSNYLETLLSSK